jgi:hypothetical protein
MTNDLMPLYVRGHSVIERIETRQQRRARERAERKARKRAETKRKDPICPDAFLVLDTECTVSDDMLQNFTVGCWRAYRRKEDAEVWESNDYVCVKEGIFHKDRLTPTERKVLERYIEKHRNSLVGLSESPEVTLCSRRAFIDNVFWPWASNGALIAGFNLSFDFSRIAVDACQSNRSYDEWSLYLFEFKDKKTGRWKIDQQRPTIKVKRINSKAAFLHFSDGSGRFLELKALGFALRDKPYSLESACEDFGVQGKLKHEPTGRTTAKEIDYCRNDVRASADLLLAMKAEFDLHSKPNQPHFDLHPDKAYSLASFGKKYFEAMGVTPPREKFALSNAVLASTMNAYFGGRTECKIKNTPLPVVLVDFMSQYPTVNALLGNQRLLIAKSSRVIEGI